ncbi:hypothetical protein SLEP1_g12282 [Rubroshorea leprosula]|uniref:Uncharacterized protein n=1 Tax=Rubroshorea leprosula TaxID=152421 RepID=A0AAV5ILG5_9ROSI|nr:hypothetical protein SLEP1_g12282 [Rubroshorea leprosula]
MEAEVESKLGETWGCKFTFFHKINKFMKSKNWYSRHLEFKKRWLEADFTIQEVKAAVAECCSKKSPDPDGFNFKFIKFAWEILEEDVMRFTQEFYANGRLGKVEIGLFEGLQIWHGDLCISHLQFVDDTMIIGKAKSERIWAIKGILRWFELMSGLKINFKKRSILGMHFDEVWMKGATEFLKCKRGVVPFACLGMPVGDNQRKRKMWMLIVENFQKNLLDWQTRSLSFSSWLIFLNLVLSSLLLYYFSVFKVPLFVVNMLEKIEREFLGRKWWARFEEWAGGLWSRVLREKNYIRRGGTRVNNYSRRLSKVWKIFFVVGYRGEI